MHEVALRLDQLWDRTNRRIRGTPKRITVEPYLAHGSTQRVVARGRVVSNAPIQIAQRVEPVWPRLRRTVRRFLTDELPDIEIAATLGAASGVDITDEEGYYRIELTGHGLPDDRLVHHLDLTVVAPPGDVTVGVGDALAHIPTRGARRIVVSDIDDTVLATGATRRARMLLTTLTGSVWTRSGFPGTPELFAGLARGSGDEDNAFVYVSSSPWNLHGFLDGFIRRSGLPVGPLFLRDLGIDEAKFIHGPHDEHKRTAIEELLELHRLPLVLVGDTGERDPEIYQSIAGSHPHRIEAVLLRHQGSDQRAAAVRALFEGVDVPLAIAGDSPALARSAESLRLIPPAWADEVAVAAQR